MRGPLVPKVAQGRRRDGQTSPHGIGQDRLATPENLCQENKASDQAA
jgi:hypothetical protein